MKNKRLTYFLLPVVAALWAYAIYLYGFSQQEEENGTPNVEVADTTLVASTDVDTFSLLLNYPDPFGPSGAPPRHTTGRFAGSESPVTVSAPTPNPTPSPASRPIPPKPAVTAAPAPPQLRYNGLVQQAGGGRPTGILRIDGKSHFVQQGSKVAGYEVHAMSTDSIALRQGNETIQIGRR